MGWGGARSGSGRKPGRPRLVPKPAKSAVSVEPSSLLDPPAWLPADQREVWRFYAPHAVDAGTLCDRTAGAFAYLCKCVVLEQAMSAALAEDGMTVQRITTDVTSGEQSVEVKAHPLLAKHAAMAKDINSRMKDFGICPYGKPVVASRKAAPAANPWATVATRTATR